MQQSNNYYSKATQEFAKGYILDYLSEKGFYLEKNKNACCFFHDNDTQPSLSYNDNEKNIKCFSSRCEMSTPHDIFNLAMKFENLSNHYQAVDFICKKYGISPDNSTNMNNNTQTPKQPQETAKTSEISNIKITNEDFKKYKLSEIIEQETTSILDIKNETYRNVFFNRGINEDTLRKLNIRYTKNLNNPLHKLIRKKRIAERANLETANILEYDNQTEQAILQKYTCKGDIYNILIPYYDNANDCRYYLGMSEKENLSHKYNFLKGISKPIINIHLLHNNNIKYYIVVEGIFDFFSIYQVLSELNLNNNIAVLCLLGVASINKLSNYIQNSNIENIKEKLFISLLDNDKAGKESEKQLKTELAKQGISLYIPEWFYNVNNSEDIKDPNEFLQKEPNKFKEYLHELYNSLEDVIKEEKKNIVDDYLNSFNDDININHFINLEQFNNSDVIYKSGFNQLDKTLQFRDGLYFVGGTSGLGKTNFILQLASNMAKNNDVLFFNLEMSKRDLIARILSRLTYSLGTEQFGYNEDATIFLSSMDITHNQGYMNFIYTDVFQKDIKEIYLSACKYYQENYSRLYFVGQLFRTNIETIKEKILNHVSITGNKPIIFIDYLQLIEPLEQFATDKMNIDNVVKELKLLSTDLNICIIVVSSLNRASYNEVISLSAFKESGLIEFTADAVIGLQYKGFRDGLKPKEIYKEVWERSRNGFFIDVELNILKNRFGMMRYIDYGIKPRYSYYAETVKEKKESENSQQNNNEE